MCRGYLRHRAPLLCLYLLVCVVFPGVVWLYGGDLAPAWYALVIISFLLLLFLAVDVARYAARRRQLQAVLRNVSEAEGALPAPGGPVEAQYRALALSLYDLLNRQEQRLTRRHGEQVEYYTVWVHQIKTPIAAMRLALQGGARPDQDLLERELFRVERYVEMALQFIKMADLSGDLVLREYRLEDIVTASVKKYAPLFIGKKLAASIRDVDRVVLTDSKWLAFILEQLLSNAVKYTGRGGVAVYGQGEALVVEDSGIGIRQEDLRRIFEKGYTGHNGRMEQRASGLGLYMAKRVADHLSIRINAESEVGKGTRMILTFPKKDAFLQ